MAQEPRKHEQASNRVRVLEGQISRIKVVPPDEASGELAEQYSRMRDVDGSVANILTVQSLNPAALGANSAGPSGRRSLSSFPRSTGATTESSIMRRVSAG